MYAKQLLKHYTTHTHNYLTLETQSIYLQKALLHSRNVRLREAGKSHTRVGRKWRERTKRKVKRNQGSSM